MNQITKQSGNTQIQHPAYVAIKYGFILLVIIIFLIVLSKVAKMVTKNTVIDQARNNIANKNLSYDEATYTRWADELQVAANDWGITDEVVLRVIGALKNKDDWNQLVVAFGTRKIANVIGFYEATLPKMLNIELENNPETRKTTYAHLTSIGIKF